MPTKPYAGLDATPFIEIAVAAGRPTLAASDRRVYLAGARVTPETKARVFVWMTQLGVSRGVLLDMLAAFWSEHNSVARPKIQKERAGVASTPPPARHPSLRSNAKAKVVPVKPAK